MSRYREQSTHTGHQNSLVLKAKIQWLGVDLVQETASQLVRQVWSLDDRVLGLRKRTCQLLLHMFKFVIIITERASEVCE